MTVHFQSELNNFDPTQLPKFDLLDSNQSFMVLESYRLAYLATIHLGNQIASGKALETAKVKIDEILNQKSKSIDSIPLSIFTGIDTL